MATMKQKSETQPITISEFLGINLEETGDTQLRVGESGDMTNFYITKDLKLKKIEGYSSLLPNNTGTPVRGLWYGILNATTHFIFAYNGKIYRFDDDYWVDSSVWEEDWESHVTEIGTATDETTRFFPFANKVYMINGNEYKSWDGVLTNTFEDVTGYTPKIMIGSSPAGGGTDFEGINLLNPQKSQTFSADGSSVLYQVVETDVDSFDEVYINGVLTTAYTTDLTNGNITFSTAPTSGEDNVEIFWSKDNGLRDKVTNNRASILFGPNNDTRVFFYGNEDAQNRVIYSDLADGVPSVEYFPILNFLDIGSINSAVTNIERQYDIMIITKDSREAYFSEYDSFEVEDDTIVSFPVLPLNDARGNIAFAQGQIINNDPITIDDSLIIWVSTNVRDEKNALEISEKIKSDLDSKDLSKALTVDWQEKWEHWTVIGNEVYIYNYYLSTSSFRVFSRLKLNDNPSCMLIIDGDLYFGTETGEIMKLSDEFKSFNGENINSHWEMNFYDFESSTMRKTMQRLWVSMKPEPRSYAEINYITDKKMGTNPKIIEYNLYSYGSVDYSNWTYKTNYNPQPFRLKMKAKKFTYLKLVIDNNTDNSGALILSLSIKSEYGGETK